MDDNTTVEASSVPKLDEQAIAKKYGLRELTPLDGEQLKTLTASLAQRWKGRAV